MTGTTIDDIGWTSDYLESARDVWSLSVSDEDRRLLWPDALTGRWGAGEAAYTAVRSFIGSSLDAVGFVNVRNVMSPDASDADLITGLSRVLDEIGGAIPQNAQGDLWTILRDRDGDGATELGFHCDTCDLLVLLCLQPAADGGGTTKLASARHVYDIIERERPDVLALLQQEWRFDRSGRAGQQIVVTPILFTQDDGTIGCYYQTRTVRASAELDARRLEALDYLDEVLYRPEIAFGLQLGAGDLLMIRNSRVLHGRSPYVDAPGPQARRILRAWMNER
ncbi:Taurine catabolism dioxygenase TauD, TfdA family [Streptomyces sp. YIM 121038]|uniref:TauD/TfdA family dioxygenase n=1 Tax=Streptomyces sp. YIM 121038 TaxID=2136401 RepID=UPI00111046ED|nr:TauD/TfdA family dioxygenase [Streptomyces sp. YIM 121038]QCX80684.1 Taurine catabolism dioxygenase TauD, TfdA family [Streptomyces sp. YIM 121038]